jgi:hypothetical protein
VRSGAAALAPVVLAAVVFAATVGACGSGDAAATAARQAATAVAAAGPATLDALAAPGAAIASSGHLTVRVTSTGGPVRVECMLEAPGPGPGGVLTVRGSGTPLPPPLVPLPGCGGPRASAASSVLDALLPRRFAASLGRLTALRTIRPADVDGRRATEYEGTQPPGPGSPFSALFAATSPAVIVDVWLDGAHRLLRWVAQIDTAHLQVALAGDLPASPPTSTG